MSQLLIEPNNHKLNEQTLIEIINLDLENKDGKQILSYITS